MHRLRTYTHIATAVLALGLLENVLAGDDQPGTRHDVSVLFFFLSLLALVALLVLAVLALVRRSRSTT